MLPLALFLAACSSGDYRTGAHLATTVIDTLPNGTVSVPTRWTDTNGWRLVETGRIGGDADSANSLTRPQSLALDGAHRLYVSDLRPVVVKEFGPDGRGTAGGDPLPYR